MKVLRLLPALLLCCASSLSGQKTIGNDTSLLLDSLEQAVDRKAAYAEARERQCSELKQKAAKAEASVRQDCWKQLFALYLHAQADSASRYLDLIAADTATLRSPELADYLSISRANVWALRGQYFSAIKALSSVRAEALSEEMRLYYYRTCRTLYGWMANYAHGTSNEALYQQQVQCYRDSVLTLPQEESSRLVVLADQANALGRPAESLNFSRTALAMGGDTRVYSYFNMAESYRLLGDKEKELYYLSLTALADIRAGVKEYEALPRLAQRLFEAGEVERAYKFLLCSIDDATACQAPLRSLEASNLLTIVDKTYKRQQHRQRIASRLLFGGLIVFSLTLVLLVIHLRRQMKKLSQARSDLSEANLQLNDTNQRLNSLNTSLREANENIRRINEDLTISDRMKEAYVGHYLNQCHAYLDELDRYRRSLLRLHKAGQTDKLARQLNSEEWVERERRRFYADFDAAFLALFPQFVVKFNELLPPEAQVLPHAEGSLTTELRVFALIRLGVTESPRIGEFLNLSLATVYNYRSRKRNSALCPPEEFEERVASL